MLVLTRKNEESVVVGGSSPSEHMLKVTVLEIRSGQVKLGFEAPADVPVHRGEEWERILAGDQSNGPAARPAAPEEELDRWEDDGAGHREAGVPVAPAAR